MATEADKAAKRHAYENYAITTHWPAANVTVGAPPTAEERQKYSLPRTRSRVGFFPTKKNTVSVASLNWWSDSERMYSTRLDNCWSTANLGR